MSANPVQESQRTMARVIALMRTMTYPDQMAVRSAAQDFFAPILKREPMAVASAYWAANILEARHYPSDLERLQHEGTRYHEGSHIVGMRDGGIPFEKVSVPPDELYMNGCVRLLEPVPWSTPLFGADGRMTAEAWAVMELCGPIGQKMAGHWPDDNVIAKHDADAMRHLTRIVPPLPHGSLKTLREFCRERAMALIHARWPDVETIVNALRSTDTLTAVDIARLLATDNRLPMET
jgi:hypothetical protein